MPVTKEARFRFAGPAWIGAASAILQQLTAEHGEPGRRFSICERFTRAPLDIAPTGIAAWHFRIDGRIAEAGPGEIDDADVLITADYAATLPAARPVYTPEILARRAAAGPRPGVRGDMSKAPHYLVDLHNRLAAITA